LIQSAEIGPGDRVLEVGSGTGALTAALIAAGAEVTALEKDEVLARNLAQKFIHMARTSGDPNPKPPPLRIVEGDCLTVNIEGVVPLPENGQPKAKVVANIPFYLTTDLLKILLPMGDRFSSITLVMQHDVAERMTKFNAEGGEGHRAMGVRVQYYSEPEYVRIIVPEAFDPPPACHGSICHFKLKDPSDWPQMPPDQFMSFVQVVFSNRRRIVVNNLKTFYSRVVAEEALAKVNIPEFRRPQELSFDELQALYNTLGPPKPTAAPKPVGRMLRRR